MPLQVVDDQVQSSVIKAVRPDAVDEPLPGVELEQPGFFLFSSNTGQRGMVIYAG